MEELSRNAKTNTDIAHEGGRGHPEDAFALPVPIVLERIPDERHRESRSDREKQVRPEV
jgi:hypothetical protein